MNKLEQELFDFMLTKLGGELNVSRLKMASMIAEFERNGTPVGEAIEILWKNHLFGMFKLLSLDELLEILTGEGEGDLNAALARLDEGELPPLKPADLPPPSKPISRPPVAPRAPRESSSETSPQVINRTHVQNNIIEFVRNNSWCTSQTIASALNLPERAITRDIQNLVSKNRLRSQQLRDGLSYTIV